MILAWASPFKQQIKCESEIDRGNKSLQYSIYK